MPKYLKCHINAGQAITPTGDRWKAILVKEGDFVDGKHAITKRALESGIAKGIFNGVYVQELAFRDGTSRHLPRQLESAAPGGVFANAVAITAEAALEVLDDGKAAVIAFLDAIDTNWKEKMRVIAEKGHRLPGISFNAMIPKDSLLERIAEGGRKIFDILDWHTIDTFEVVTYPNAGGAIVQMVAGLEDDPDILHSDRTSYMLQELLRYLSLRGIAVQGESVDEVITAAVAHQSFGGLKTFEQRLVESLPIVKENDVQTRIVASLLEAANANADTPENESDKADTANEPDALAETDAENETTGKVEPVATDTENPAKDAATVQASLEKVLDAKMQQYMKRFDEAIAKREAEMINKERLQAGIAEINGSSLPDAFKQLAIEQFKAGKRSATEVIKTFSKAVAPLQESGRVRASVSYGDTLTMGLNSRDKKQIALMRMLGGKPRDNEKSDWQNVPAFRGLQEAFEVTTGIPVHRLGPGEFNDAYTQRIRADIDMFMPTDFPKIMDATMNRALLDLYGEQEHTWKELATKRTGVKDFRPLRMNRLGGFDAPLPKYADTKVGINDRWGGGIQLIGVPGEQENSYRVDIYAGQFILSYEALIDDDINALQHWLKEFAAVSDETALWLCMQRMMNCNAAGVINAGTSYNGAALYSEANGNLMAKPMTYESLLEAQKMIRKQRRLGGGRPLHLTPAIVVCGEENRDIIETLLAPEMQPNDSSNNVNRLRGQLKPIILDEYWLGDTEASKRNWYMMCDPSRNAALEMSFLFDREEPQILSQNGPTEGIMFTALRTTFSAVHIVGCGIRNHEPILGSFPLE